MSNYRIGARISLRAAAGISVLAAAAMGVGACGAGGATRANTTAAAVSPAAQSVARQTGAVDATTQIPAAATQTQTQTQAHATAPTPAPKKGTTVAPSAASGSPKSTTAPTPTVAVAVPTTTGLPARRHPSAAEVNQVIASVHALIPLFTPTPAQIAQVGNQVCTAFDQGKTAAQVKATAMQMAGVYAALIPAGVTDSAVHTIVTLFCPGYTSKLA